MIGRIISALVGREMGRRNGSGGASGAVKGVVAMGLMRRMGPLGMILGGGYAAKKAYDRNKARKTGY
ncbi:MULTISPECIES: hypothetical protein [Sphingomonas]|uniref:hypothetical protein n=1 Tax=Sphingomonas TaxID=13687 RepID=UPI000FFB745D|nr:MULTISPECIES: hypothetical protein [Sphingomonas]MCK8456694.1 hypothetical protein [Sphingomonas faeni]RXD05114.1 hypothetical protein EQZ23_08320 [Sphingomonas sp. UV9]